MLFTAKQSQSVCVGLVVSETIKPNTFPSLYFFTSLVTILSKSLWSKESFSTSKITWIINSWLTLGSEIGLTLYAIYKQDYVYVLLSMTDETMPIFAFVFTHNFTFVWFACILPLALLSHDDSVS